MSVADLASECGEWDTEALAAHPVTAFSDHIRSSRVRLLDFFKIIDARTHGHGRLSDRDMVHALQEMGIPLSDDQIERLVEQIKHEAGKITYASLKHTMEHHRVSVLRPLRKERESWIHHPMRKYSIKSGHRKSNTAPTRPLLSPELPQVTSPQWDTCGEVSPGAGETSGFAVPGSSFSDGVAKAASMSANIALLSSPHRNRNEVSSQNATADLDMSPGRRKGTEV